MRQILIALGILVAPLANATSVTWVASGIVTSANGSGTRIIPLTVDSGDSFSFSFTFDNATSDAIPGDPNFGAYNNLFTSATVTAGAANEFSQTFLPTGSNNYITIVDSTTDYFRVSQTTPYAPTGYTRSLFMTLASPSTVGTGPIFNDLLPASPPVASQFLSQRDFQFGVWNYANNVLVGSSSFNGIVNSFVEVPSNPVPVPAALWLLLSGAGGLLGLARRRRA